MGKENLKSLELKLQNVAALSTTSKWKRMCANPFKYFYAIIFREFFYKRNRKEIEVSAKTFFDQNMKLLLPSSTDIYLTGGKSHPSEIRLASFLIKHIKAENTFLDIGAHYGYFSLLASILVEEKGKVISIEASPKTFQILQKNQQANQQLFHIAASDISETITFYEFPNLYSEYNTTDVNIYKNEQWFQKFPPKAIQVTAAPIDKLILQHNIKPQIIKIDVEGAENKVILGMKEFLTNNSPYLILEYLADDKKNSEHKKAIQLLSSLSYEMYGINEHGLLNKIEKLEVYLKNMNSDSENIIFKK